MRTIAWASMYKPNGRNHVRAASKMSYEHVHLRGLSPFCVGKPSRRVGILSGRAVSVHTLQASPSRQTVPIRRLQ